MAPRRWLVLVAMATLPVGLAGCFDEPPDRADLVFVDALEPGVFYQPFLNSKQDPVGVDPSERYAGNDSLRYSVPTPGEPGAGAFNFSGGAFTADVARDLSQFTALTFWARASREVSFDSLGMANDNTGGSLYQTEWKGVPLTTTWTRYVVPIPAPHKLTSERGLLWLAAGAKGTPPTGYRVWLDEVRFEALDASAWNPRPALTGGTRTLGVDETYQIEGTAVTYTAGGRELQLAVFPSTFDYLSSNPSVATVSPRGLITGHGAGSAVISARLAGVAVPQTVTIGVGAGLSPLAGPPAPTRPAADVISVYSDSYTNVPVDKLAADWSNGCSSPICPRWSEVTLGGNRASKYTDLVYTAIECLAANEIDATAMTHLHVDVWTHDSSYFKLKLVDFGANGVYDNGGDDRSHELTFDASSTPALATGQWVGLDVPLAAFTGLTTRAHLAQVVFSASTSTVFIDNVYFHR